MLKMIEKKEFNNLSDYLAALIQENRYEKLGISRTDNIVIDALINAKYIYAQKMVFISMFKLMFPFNYHLKMRI